MRAVTACVIAGLGLSILSVRLAADDALIQRIQHTDPAKYRPLTAVHGGAGNMAFAALLRAGPSRRTSTSCTAAKSPPAAASGITSTTRPRRCS